MQKEPLCESLVIAMTEHEKRLLQSLAYAQGATMSGFVRKLIRDARRETNVKAMTNEVHYMSAKETSENEKSKVNTDD